MTRRRYNNHYTNEDKWRHFQVGLSIGFLYLCFICNAHPAAFKQINLGLYCFVVVWASSGWFGFRSLRIPILSSIWLYMAIPDWDIRFYKFTKDPMFRHRSVVTHSNLIPTLLFILSKDALYHHPSGLALILWKLLLHLSMYLNVGISGHLTWDFIQSTFSTKRGFCYCGLPRFESAFVLYISLYFGLVWTFDEFMAISRIL